MQIEKIETRELLISTFVAKTLVAKLADTTSAVNQMFGNDLNITLRILNEVLDYENSQTDMRNLTSEQDSKYLTVSYFLTYILPSILLLGKEITLIHCDFSLDSSDLTTFGFVQVLKWMSVFEK